MEFDLSKFDEYLKKAQEQWDYLDTLASGGEEFNPEEESEYPSVKKVHNLAVLLLSHPLNFSVEKILDYVGSKGIDKSIVTEHLIEAWKSLPDFLKDIKSGKPIYFPTMQATALLESLNTDIELILDKRKSAKIQIGFASAIDLLYNNGDLSIKSKEWIRHIFEIASIDPLLVRSIKPYPKEFALSFDITKENIVDFLAKRFEKIFECAVIFFQIVNETTRQFPKEAKELYKWNNSNRFAMQQDAIKVLPIINATHEDYEPVELTFRDPIISMASITHSYDSRYLDLLLHKIENVTDKASILIRNIFLERVDFPNSISNMTVYFLRRKYEMLENLSNLSNEEKASFSAINFFEYLSAIGYPELKLK